MTLMFRVIVILLAWNGDHLCTMLIVLLLFHRVGTGGFLRFPVVCVSPGKPGQCAVSPPRCSICSHVDRAPETHSL
jgi:hypothetical protein